MTSNSIMDVLLNFTEGLLNARADTLGATAANQLCKHNEDRDDCCSKLNDVVWD